MTLMSKTAAEYVPKMFPNVYVEKLAESHARMRNLLERIVRIHAHGIDAPAYLLDSVIAEARDALSEPQDAPQAVSESEPDGSLQKTMLSTPHEGI